MTHDSHRAGSDSDSEEEEYVNEDVGVGLGDEGEEVVPDAPPMPYGSSIRFSDNEGIDRRLGNQGQRRSPISTDDPLDQILNFVVVVEGGRRVVPVASPGRRKYRSGGLCGLMAVPAEMSINIDLSPYQIVNTMHLNKVDLVFRMLKVTSFPFYDDLFA